jgi:hypothetical protein
MPSKSPEMRRSSLGSEIKDQVTFQIDSLIGEPAAGWKQRINVISELNKQLV